MAALNGSEHVIEVVQNDSFKIGSTLGFDAYTSGGVAKQKKVPVNCTFATLEESLSAPKIDESMHSDFSKVDIPMFIFTCLILSIAAPPPHHPRGNTRDSPVSPRKGAAPSSMECR